MRKGVFATVVICVLVACCSAATTAAQVQSLLQAFTPGPGNVGCIDFSSRVGPYSWGTGVSPPISFVDQLLTIIQTQTPYRCIMIYDVYSDIIQVAQSKGFKVLAIVWLTLDPTENTAAQARAITAARTYPDTILGFSCGSELAFRNDIASVNSITLNCINTLRNNGITHPIGVIDSLKTWNSNWTIANQADFMGVNIYVWYDNTGSNPTCTTAAEAAQQTLNRFKNVQAKYSKPFIMTEFGWPGSDSGTVTYNCGVTNDATQKLVVSNVIDLFRQNRLPLSTFQAFRDKTKGDSTTLFKRYWGICMGDAPYNCVSAPTAFVAPTPTPAQTCPPLPDSCPCGVIIPQGSICKRCKLECPTTTAAPTTTTAAPTTATPKPTPAPTTTPKPTTTTTVPPTTTTTTAPTTTPKPTTTQAPTTTTPKPTPAPTTTTSPPTTTTTTAPTCPPIPSDCPCGIVLPAGSTCKRCKIDCPTTTAAPTTTTTTPVPTTTTTAAPTTTTAAPTTSKPTSAPTTTTAPPTTTTPKPTPPPTTTPKPTTTTTMAPTTPAPTPKPIVTTCPPVPDNCPCGIVLPEGAVCKRCKLNCPTTTITPTTTTAAPTTTKAPTTTTAAPTTAKPTPTPTCPANWIKYGTSCYMLGESLSSWADAKASCTSLGSKLAVIKSTEENSFVLSSVGSGNTQSAWLGYNLVGTTYLTVESQAPSYLNWKQDQPDNTLGCVVMIRDAVSTNVGKWKTENCATGRTYVCKKEL